MEEQERGDETTELEKYGESEATTESISYALGGTLGVQTSERERERETQHSVIYTYTLSLYRVNYMGKAGRERG